MLINKACRAVFTSGRGPTCETFCRLVRGSLVEMPCAFLSRKCITVLVCLFACLFVCLFVNVFYFDFKSCGQYSRFSGFHNRLLFLH